ncbi:hypothetical protein B9Z55_006611 [Caenorhabditis nigoni]|uniref:Uncharacterized protein n=1 Tax=Caenorhabditis nigoni TaxID=1611254 RepID=A0A2G5V601_9PELO|nr:hypothetical protein B9Z55_006611 [Caenorhabditis nigoni]
MFEEEVENLEPSHWFHGDIQQDINTFGSASIEDVYNDDIRFMFDIIELPRFEFVKITTDGSDEALQGDRHIGSIALPRNLYITLNPEGRAAQRQQQGPARLMVPFVSISSVMAN